MVKKTGAILRGKPGHQSLWLTFARASTNDDIAAVLYNHLTPERKYSLKVLQANANGIALKLPQLRSGIYSINVSDGLNSFLRDLVIQ